MPLFEYRCRGCDNQFELLVRGGATPACPSCGSTSLERVISMFAVSSDAMQRRSRRLLGDTQRQKAQRDRAEQDFYKRDHHDD